MEEGTIDTKKTSVLLSTSVSDITPHSIIYGKSKLLKNTLDQVNIVFVNLQTQSKVNEFYSTVKYFPLFSADSKSWPD